VLPDYENIAMPNAEAAHESVVWLHHSLLLASRDVLDDVAEALHGLQTH
jgi:hypothetical protein